MSRDEPPIIGLKVDTWTMKTKNPMHETAIGAEHLDSLPRNRFHAVSVDWLVILQGLGLPAKPAFM